MFLNIKVFTLFMFTRSAKMTNYTAIKFSHTGCHIVKKSVSVWNSNTLCLICDIMGNSCSMNLKYFSHRIKILVHYQIKFHDDITIDICEIIKQTWRVQFRSDHSSTYLWLTLLLKVSGDSGNSRLYEEKSSCRMRTVVCG